MTTNARGVATLTDVPGIMAPLSIRVAGPGVAPHALPLDASREKTAVIRLSRSGRLVGIVRTAAGGALEDVAVELWVQGSDMLPRELRDEKLRSNPSC